MKMSKRTTSEQGLTPHKEEEEEEEEDCGEEEGGGNTGIDTDNLPAFLSNFARDFS